MKQETQKKETMVEFAEAPPQVSDSEFNKLLEKERSLQLSCFDNKTFDQLYKVAEVLANSSLIPDSFKGDKKGLYPHEKVVANCFLVVEQAHRWDMSPFAIIGCAAPVRGRITWEGKLVHAVLENKLGVRLSYEFNDKAGDALGVIVSGALPGEVKPRTIEGTVGDWKTTGDNSPWVKTSGRKFQLCYRGARQWGRVHAPGVMLGVVTKDEAQDFSNSAPAADDPINPFGEKAKGSERLVTTEDPKRVKMIEEINDLAHKLGKTNDDWNRLFEHYAIFDLDEAKNIQLRSILAKLKKEKPDELELEGSVE